MGSGTFYPAASGDDGYVYGPTIRPDRDYLYFGNSIGSPNNIYVRFVNVTIPQGAVITEAFIRGKSRGNDSTTIVRTNIYFNDADNAVAPTTATQFDNLVKTTAFTAWDGLAAWTTSTSYDTPSLIDEVQEVVNRGGFSSGNAVMAMVYDDSSEAGARRQYSAFDYDSGSQKLELHVTWAVNEVVCPSPLSAEGTGECNIQIELSSSPFVAVGGLNVSGFFSGVSVDCPAPFGAVGSLDSNIQIDLALSPFEAESSLKSNIQIDLALSPFTAQGDLSVSEVLWGYFLSMSPFAAEGSLKSNIQIDLVPGPLQAITEMQSNIQIDLVAGALTAQAGLTTGNIEIIDLGEHVSKTYRFILTGSPDGKSDLEIPISSFQARAKQGNPTSLSVVIPGVEYASAIADRPNGAMIVYMLYNLAGTEIAEQEVVSVDLESVRLDEGAINQSMTLTGRRIKSWDSKEMELSGMTYKNLVDGKYRYRIATPNLYLNPGDAVTIDGHSCTIDNITWFVSPSMQSMEFEESNILNTEYRL